MCVCCLSPLLSCADSEMLWCQAAGALFVGMLSELVYTSILGMLGGMAYGECTTPRHDMEHILHPQHLMKA